jgi:hypothetical protein
MKLSFGMEPKFQVSSWGLPVCLPDFPSGPEFTLVGLGQSASAVTAFSGEGRRLPTASPVRMETKVWVSPVESKADLRQRIVDIRSSLNSGHSPATDTSEKCHEGLVHPSKPHLYSITLSARTRSEDGDCRITSPSPPLAKTPARSDLAD